MKHVHVIGSGIGGLAVAIRLAHKGYRVTIFEKNENPGGKIGELKLGDFRFDTGPSLFTLPEVFFELFELSGKKASDYIDIVNLPLTCNYFFADGTNLKAWSQRDKFISEAVDAGANGQILDKYLKRQAFVYNHASDFFMFNSLHKLSTYVGKAGQKSLKALHKLDALRSMHSRNKKTFGTGKLTQLFDRYATYNGSNPYKAPATLNMIAHLEHSTGAYFPKNGMRGIVKALVKLAYESGVEFHLSEAVKSIQKQADNTWITQTSEQSYTANIVVNNTDVTYFYKNIMPNTGMYRKLMKRECSSSALIFYWGVNLSSELDVHNILFSVDYKAEFEGLFRQKAFADDLTVYIFISKKVVDEDAPPGKENWFVMVNAPENIGQNPQQYISKARKILVDKIKTRLKIDIEKYIETESILTPADIEFKTASVNGSLYGHSSNNLLSAFLRHPNFSRRHKNLYFTGGSVHPGGGIPLCLASAKIVDGFIANNRSANHRE